jgi:hypothetical protein
MKFPVLINVLDIRKEANTQLKSFLQKNFRHFHHKIMILISPYFPFPLLALASALGASALVHPQHTNTTSLISDWRLQIDVCRGISTKLLSSEARHEAQRSAVRCHFSSCTQNAIDIHYKFCNSSTSSR